MAIYRAPSRRPLILAGIGGIVVGLLIGIFVGRATVPDLASQIASARAEVRPILSSLDVVRIEYESLLSGGDSGSEGAIARAREAFEARKPTLVLLNPNAAARLDAALTRIADAVAAKVPLADLEAAVTDAEAIAGEILGT